MNAIEANKLSKQYFPSKHQIDNILYKIKKEAEQGNISLIYHEKMDLNTINHLLKLGYRVITMRGGIKIIW